MAGKTLEQDLKDLMIDFEHQAFEYEIHGNIAIDVEEGIALGKNRAYKYAANKIRNLLEWHGLLPNETATTK